MRMAQIYFNVNMSNGHHGLALMLDKPLRKGDCAIFINRGEIKYNKALKAVIDEWWEDRGN